MSIKNCTKKILFSLSSGLTDALYRRPFFDSEAKKRRSLKDEILHLDLVITECCSLKCRDCSNMMQYYQKPENIPSEAVINDLGRLLDLVRVTELKIIGGEPFVNQKTLSDVIRFLSGKYGEKVDCINIITNGTIVPGDDCLAALSDNPKVMVTLSNYGKLSSHQDELIAVLKGRNIRYSMIDESFYWLDFGQPQEYKESEEFVRRQYKNCYNRKYCNTLFRGRLYVCPRQAHGIHLGLLPDDKDGYVDLNSSAYDSDDELKKAVLGIVKREQYISACRYCINGKYIHVPRGVQKSREQ